MTSKDAEYLASDQEAADIKLILHPNIAARCGATSTTSSNLISCWKALQETCSALEYFVCQPYLPNMMIKEVQEARWWILSKMGKQKASFQGILRAHYHCMIWYNSTVTIPKIPSPLKYGGTCMGGKDGDKVPSIWSCHSSHTVWVHHKSMKMQKTCTQLHLPL